MEGEFFSIVGPSGAGKTTTLLAALGGVSVSSGTILLDGNDITKLPSHKRGIPVVFQNLALFPHLNVYQNVAFGLRTLKIPKKIIDDRVNAVLKSLSIYELANKRIDKISGGQRQRVALARALVVEPSIIFLDEPFSSLDPLSRLEAQNLLEELKQKQNLDYKKLTVLMVTHDQAEASMLSDRILVMNGGSVEQIGEPEEIYTHPGNFFVAEFFGSINFVIGTLKGAKESFLEIQMADGQIIKINKENCHNREMGRELRISFRPTECSLLPIDDSFIIPGIVREKKFINGLLQLTFISPFGTIKAIALNEDFGKLNTEDKANLFIKKSHLKLF